MTVIFQTPLIIAAICWRCRRPFMRRVDRAEYCWDCRTDTSTTATDYIHESH